MPAPLVRRVALIVVAIASLAWLFVSIVPQEADAASGGDWLAFVRDPTGGARFESGDEEIWAIRLDGSGAVRLTTNTCIDITPAASPNGKWLAWVQKCGSLVDLMIAPITYDASGHLHIGAATNVTLSLGPGADRWPQFSPDGRSLAFMRRTSGNFDIWRATFTGGTTGPALSGAVRVVRLGGTHVEDCCVSWSPDGAHLVWASNVNRYQQSFNLYRIASSATEVWDATRNVDGSPDGTLDVTIVQQLTSGREYEGTPHYDANGTVLFRCNCPNGDVYRIDPATRIRTRLTTHLGLDRTPEGYPGGITYSRFDTVGGDEIYVAGPNGESPRNVTRHAWSDRDPTFIPAQR
jgi:Tol biopolymer transport system component